MRSVCSAVKALRPRMNDTGGAFLGPEGRRKPALVLKISHTMFAHAAQQFCSKAFLLQSNIARA